MYLMGILEVKEREDRTDTILEKIMVENFPKLDQRYGAMVYGSTRNSSMDI